MTQKHREYGLRPNTITRRATAPIVACGSCGAVEGVERAAGVYCAYCGAAAVLA